MMIMGRHIPTTEDEGRAVALKLTRQERTLVIALGIAIMAFASALAGVAEPTQASSVAELTIAESTANPVAS